MVFNKKNVLTPSIIHWWRGGYGFYHTQREFPDVWAHSEDLSSDIDTVFVSKHYDGFFSKTKITIFGTCRVDLAFFSVRQRSQYWAPAE